MASTLLRLIVASGVLGLLRSPRIAGHPPQEPAGDRAVLAMFDERVGSYVAVHRRFEQHLHPPESVGSRQSFRFRQMYLASAIKAARPNAAQGHIFVPPVADFFRRTIAAALSAVDVDRLLRDVYAHHETMIDFHPRVYDPYPDWATHEMPSLLRPRLPPLPKDLEYGLLDHDLVIWDIHADLIVDVLPDAVRRASS